MKISDIYNKRASALKAVRNSSELDKVINKWRNYDPEIPYRYYGAFYFNNGNNERTPDEQSIKDIILSQLEQITDDTNSLKTSLKVIATSLFRDENLATRALQSTPQQDTKTDDTAKSTEGAGVIGAKSTADTEDDNNNIKINKKPEIQKTAEDNNINKSTSEARDTAIILNMIEEGMFDSVRSLTNPKYQNYLSTSEANIKQLTYNNIKAFWETLNKMFKTYIDETTIKIAKFYNNAEEYYKTFTELMMAGTYKNKGGRAEKLYDRAVENFNKLPRAQQKEQTPAPTKQETPTASEGQNGTTSESQEILIKVWAEQAPKGLNAMLTVVKQALNYNNKQSNFGTFKPNDIVITMPSEVKGQLQNWFFERGTIYQNVNKNYGKQPTADGLPPGTKQYYDEYATFIKQIDDLSKYNKFWQILKPGDGEKAKEHEKRKEHKQQLKNQS